MEIRAATDTHFVFQPYGSSKKAANEEKNGGIQPFDDVYS